MATKASNRHVLITGPPGVGKTTLVRKVCELLLKSCYPVKGFYTEEVRLRGRRSGFDIVTVDNHRGILARVSDQSGDIVGGRDYRVGQYSVNLQSFEEIALPAISIQSNSSKVIYIVDEIGKMELFSSTFVQSVRKLFNNQEAIVLATIPVSKGRPIPLVEELRNRKDCTVFEISKANRDSVWEEVLKIVKNSFDQNLKSEK